MQAPAHRHQERPHPSSRYETRRKNHFTGPGPSYVPLLEMTADQVRHEVGDHLVLGLEVARCAAVAAPHIPIYGHREPYH